MIMRVVRGVGTAVRAQPRVFAGVVIAMLVLSVLLPVAVLSVFRKRVDYFTFNPWLSNLPEYLASHPDPWSKKLAFLSDMALAWFLSNSPIEGVEWGFIIDVPSVVRFLLTSLLFGAYFALWAHRRHATPFATGRYAGTAGAATSVMGFTTGACSVTGCGVPVLPVVGLALTGLSSGMVTFLGQLARVGTTVVLLAVAVGVAWLGWQAGATNGAQPPRVAATPSPRSHP